MPRKPPNPGHGRPLPSPELQTEETETMTTTSKTETPRIEWKRLGAGFYRSLDGRFSIIGNSTRPNRPSTGWVLLDKSIRDEFDQPTSQSVCRLESAKTQAAIRVTREQAALQKKSR